MTDHATTTLCTWTAAELAADPLPTLFQKVLLATDGTVTELLSLHGGRPMRARKLAQSLGERQAPAGLDSPPGAAVLHRTVVLEPDGAAQPGTPVDRVFAESFFVFERFSASLQRSLLETEAPIGLLWRGERLEMFREIVDRRMERNAPVAGVLGVPLDAALLSRTYSISHGGRTLGLITEKFARSAFR